MYTQSRLDRSLIVALCILLAAVCLPLTAQADIRIDKANLSLTQITGVNVTIVVYFKVCFVTGTKAVKVTTYHTTSSTTQGSIIRANRQYSTNGSCIDNGISMAFGKEVEKGTNYVHVVFEQPGGTTEKRVLPINVIGDANIGFNGVPTLSAFKAKIGDELTVSFKLKNSGITRSKSTSEVKILYTYIANDSNDPQKTKRFSASVAVPQIDAFTNLSNTQTLKFKVPVPDRRPNGDAYTSLFIAAYIDPDHTITEASKSDNYKTFAINLQLPDIALTSLSITPDPISGAYVNDKPDGRYTVDYCLKNSSQMAFSGTLECEVAFFDKRAYPNQTPFSVKFPVVNISNLANGLFCSNTSASLSPILAKVEERALGGSLGVKCVVVDPSKSDVKTSDDEQTQTATLSDWVDYQITNVTVSPTAAKPGQVVTVKTTIKHVGNTIHLSPTLSFGLLTSTTSGTVIKADVPYTQSFFQTTVITTQLTMPSGLGGGPANFLVAFSPNSVLGDNDNTNNDKSTSFTLYEDKDKDGAFTDVDCDDNDKTINPSAKEVCDGFDNNCNNQVDEGCACKQGDTRDCFTGNTGCVRAGAQNLYTCQSPCKTGTQTCTAGMWGNCTGEVKAQAETCNGKDDDCNGKTDDAITPKPCYSGPSNTKGVGNCKEGVSTCVNGTLVCQGEVTAKNEVCDGKDNDCDGATDEDFTDKDLPCFAGSGACQGKGTFVCSQDGKSTICNAKPLPPSAEVCNGKDDDCNGMIDDGLPAMKACYGGPAGTKGVGKCKEGIETCVAGVPTCNDVQPTLELCNNQDDDCDGSTDENVTKECFDGPGVAGLGLCQKGTQTCKAGSFGPCLNQVTAKAETCDGTDQDCDGAVDDGVSRACYTGPAGTSGVGDCKAGVELCVGGVFNSLCAGEVKPSQEVCDGKDNDCNGLVDDSAGCSEPGKEPGKEPAQELLSEVLSEPPPDFEVTTEQPKVLDASAPDASIRDLPAPDTSSVGPERLVPEPAPEVVVGAGCESVGGGVMPSLFLLLFLLLGWRTSRSSLPLRSK